MEKTSYLYIFLAVKPRSVELAEFSILAIFGMSLPEPRREPTGRHAIVEDAAVAIDRRHHINLTVQRFVAVASDRVALVVREVHLTSAGC